MMNCFTLGFLIAVVIASAVMAVWESRMEIHWHIRRRRAARHRMALRVKRER